MFPIIPPKTSGLYVVEGGRGRRDRDSRGGDKNAVVGGHQASGGYDFVFFAFLARAAAALALVARATRAARVMLAADVFPPSAPPSVPPLRPSLRK